MTNPDLNTWLDEVLEKLSRDHTNVHEAKQSILSKFEELVNENRDLGSEVVRYRKIFGEIPTDPKDLIAYYEAHRKTLTELLNPKYKENI